MRNTGDKLAGLRNILAAMEEHFDALWRSGLPKSPTHAHSQLPIAAAYARKKKAPSQRTWSKLVALDRLKLLCNSAWQYLRKMFQQN